MIPSYLNFLIPKVCSGSRKGGKWKVERKEIIVAFCRVPTAASYIEEGRRRKS